MIHGSERTTLFALLSAAALCGCFEASEVETAARVGDWQLTSSELGDLLVLAQPYPLESGVVAELARHWVGVGALALRYAAGDALLGAEAARHSMWLETREALLAAERDDRLGAFEVNAEQAFEDGEYRLIAHVLRRVGPETSREERELQRRTAERVLAGLVSGGSWDAAVEQSQDLETRSAAGLLGLLATGELPATLDRVAFRLEPGQVSSVVESDLGFHVLYRPRYTDVAGLYAARLRSRRLEEADAAAARGLLAERELAVSPRALEAVRSLAERPVGHLGAEETLASWRGGALSTGTVARYTAALPAAARSELSTASEVAVRGFIEEIGLRELRIVEAQARGVRLDSEIATRLVEQHAEEVSAWIEELGLEADGGASRARLSERMRDLVSRRVETRSLPPLFEAWLLERVEWSVSEAGIARAIERARAMIEASG